MPRPHRRLASLLALLLAWAAPTAAQGKGWVDFVAHHEGATDDLRVLVDPAEPEVEIVSPAWGSVIAGNAVTITGTVTDSVSWFDPSLGGGPLFDEVLYRVLDDSWVELGSGTGTLVDGRFTLPDVILGTGVHYVEVLVTDSAGNLGYAELRITSDPSAPLVTLVSPEDGQALLTSTATIDLNFSGQTTLVSVDGTPDGRVFDAGLALGALELPLDLGANSFTLELDAGSGPFELSFTLFRVDELAGVRIVSPAPDSFLNTETVTVEGTAPLGTPLVAVNGIFATLAPDGVAFSVEIPIQAGENEIRAVAYPFGQSASLQVTADFVAPSFLAYVPEDGTATLDEDVIFAGFVDEPAEVILEGPAGSVSGRTIPDASQGGSPFAPSRHVFDLDPLDLALGSNALTLRAVDAAGNETVETLTLLRTESALLLVSPAVGTPVPALRTDVTLEALEDVTLSTWYAAGRRLPALEGASLTTGFVTVPDIPLLPGANEMRVVYQRAEALPEILSFDVESTATGAATVTGTVTDAQTGESIAGAQVSITVNGITLVTYTNESGVYSTDLEPGSVAGVAVAEGFATEGFSAEPGQGETAFVDLALAPTGLPSFANEVEIIVPPDGTVTDFEALTVVGEVLNPASTVTVNGVPATVIGNRFTARTVPLTMGANTLEVTATVPGSPNATDSVSVERAEEPVLQVKIFSPPASVLAPGSGLVVRGFVSAAEALTLAGDQYVEVEEGVFQAFDVPVVGGEGVALTAASQTTDAAQSETDVVRIDVASAEPALELRAEPASGIAPLDTTLTLHFGVEPFPVARIDFDVDGDGQLDLIGASEASVATSVDTARLEHPRAFVTTPEGVELSASIEVNSHLEPAVLSEFAAGNPVDLALGPNGGLYVLDAAAASVTLYDGEGNEVSSFGASGAGPDQLLSPQGLAVGSGGEIYVADTGNDRIQVFSDAGVLIRTLGSAGSAPGEFNQPRAVAIDGDQLVVSDAGNGRVQVLDPEGNPLATVPIEAPRGLNVGSRFALIVASPAAGLLSLYGEELTTVSPLGPISPQDTPTAPVDTASSSSAIWVAESDEQALLLFSERMEFRQRIDLDSVPMAVVASPRRDAEAAFVADGQRVLEVSATLPSPVPVVEALRGFLIAGDTAQALQLIHPLQRRIFEGLYAEVGAQLPAHGSAMSNLRIDLVRPDRAIVYFDALSTVGGVPTTKSFPVYLTREEDGEWLILDY